MGDRFEIGQQYVDKGTYRNEEDQFLRWIRGPLSSGIKNTGGIRDVSSQSGGIAALVLVSNDKGVSQHADPWEDNIDLNTGEIAYWGDAKAGNIYDESVQNRKVKRAFIDAASNRRDRVPPILVFQKPEPGIVRFCGLCVPDSLEISKYKDETDRVIPNYKFHLHILNADSVPVRWIHERAQASEETSAPVEWEEWVTTGNWTIWPDGATVDPDETSTRGQLRTSEREEYVISAEFRDETLERYERRCAITGISQPELLEVAHVRARSEQVNLVEAPENVIVLNSLHHQAYDNDLFAIDSDYRIRVDPELNSDGSRLMELLLEMDGEKVRLPEDENLSPGLLKERNEEIQWL